MKDEESQNQHDAKHTTNDECLAYIDADTRCRQNVGLVLRQVALVHHAGCIAGDRRVLSTIHNHHHWDDGESTEHY